MDDEILWTEIDDEDVEQRIEGAARAYFGIPEDTDDCWLEIHFEHGQHWCLVYDYNNLDEEKRTFSVVDAIGGDSVDGFSFEEV